MNDIVKYLHISWARLCHCLIPTIQQMFCNHKFKRSRLYTVLVCVRCVSDCQAKHHRSLLLLQTAPQVSEGKASGVISPSDYNQCHPDDSIPKELHAKHLPFLLRKSVKHTKKTNRLGNTFVSFQRPDFVWPLEEPVVVVLFIKEEMWDLVPSREKGLFYFTMMNQ